MMTNRIKAQGKRLKVKGSRFFPCTLHLAPCFSHLASPAVQRGFSLVSAIFLLVVIAALGTFAVTLSTTQHQSEAMDVMGARAYQAARAGIEWAAFGVSQPASGVQWAGCVPTTNLGVLGGTLAPFAVAVNCNSASHVEDTSTVWIYDVNAVAQTAGSPGDPGYVERVISVKMGR